jgi:hypothetical protein
MSCREIWALVKHGALVPSMEYQPDPYMLRDDADLYLFFLSGNGVSFSKPTEDPWYRATRPCKKLANNIGKGTRTFFCADEAASPLACLEQYQFCQANQTRCGPLASFSDGFARAAEAFGGASSDLYQFTEGDSEFQFENAATSRLAWLGLLLRMLPTNIGGLVGILQSQSLSSKQNFGQGIQGPLPSNQWQLDVIHWWSTALALTQAAFVDTARGIQGAGLESLRVFPSNQAQLDMCLNQVRKTKDPLFLRGHPPLSPPLQRISCSTK